MCVVVKKKIFHYFICAIAGRFFLVEESRPFAREQLPHNLHALFFFVFFYFTYRYLVVIAQNLQLLYVIQAKKH